MTYVSVPFYYAQYMHSVGGKWNDEKKAWFVDDTEENCSIRFGTLNKKEHKECYIEKEDRMYQGKYKLPIVVIENSKIAINKLKARFIYYRADCKCEACGVAIKKLKPSYNIHVIYDENYNMKKYILVCDECLFASRLNLNCELSKQQDRIERLMLINNISREELYYHLVDSFNQKL